MKAQLPLPQHYSYLQHRRQVVRQILLPVIAAFLLLIALVVWIANVTFTRQAGDVSRWAAVSTIWLVLPMLLGGLLFLLIQIGLIYLLSLALARLPHYSGQAQDYVFKARGFIIRGANLIVKPILAVEGFLDNLKSFFGRIIP